jgi:hypothetical protein
MTLVLAVLGIVGMGRLGGRMGLRGPGRYLAGLVLIAGPGTSMLVGRGAWTALCAAALLPWAVRAAFVHPHELGRSRLGHVGWALITGLFVAAFSPMLALAPILVVAVWKLLRGDRGSFVLAVVAAAAGSVGVAFLLGDPDWLTNTARGLGVVVEYLGPAMVLVAAVPMVAVEGRARLVALTGGPISLAALAVGRLTPLPPGVEEAVFVVASLGAALAVAAALDALSKDVFRIAAAVGGVALMVASTVALGNGRLGLPGGDVNERLSFATTLADGMGSGRILHASTDRSLIPGEARSGPGYWYRVLDGNGTTLDEVWLPDAQAGDDDLGVALREISSGANLRPGSRLASFAIDWVVLEGPGFILDDALTAQLDLVPLPLDPDARVYENLIARPMAGTIDRPWDDDGLGFSGPAMDGRVEVAMNYDSGWAPDPAPSDWYLTVDGNEGTASWSAPTLPTALSIAVVTMLVGSLAMIGLGRRFT